VIEASIQRGLPLPDWFYDKPPLVKGDEFYLSSFRTLAHGRVISDKGVPEPLSWRDIAYFSEFYQLENDLRELFVDVIISLDNTYLNYVASKRKARELLDNVSNN